MNKPFYLEYDEKDITSIIEDENGNEIGFCMYDDKGIEREYYYADDEKKKNSSDDDVVIESLNLTKGEVKQGAKSLNNAAKEGKEVAGELKSALSDIMDSLKGLKL